jgi:hypothetical protein
MSWAEGAAAARADIDLNTYEVRIDFTDPTSGKRRRFLA